MEARKIDAEIVNLIAQTAKLVAETAKINAETRWYPFAAGAAFVAGVIALTKLLL